MEETGTGKAISKLEELTTIEFPISINEEEAYRVLEFVSKDLGYEIEDGNFRGYYSVKDGKLEMKYLEEIKGNIGSKHGILRVNFSVSRSPFNYRDKLSKLKFDTIPSCDLEKLDKGEVETWRNVRESIEKYFRMSEVAERAHTKEKDRVLKKIPKQFISQP